MSAEHQGAYIVLVAGKLKPGYIDKFVEFFKPLAKHVAAEETGTLSYQLSICDTDPDRLVIFERYTTKEYLETVHWQSAAFKEFQSKVREAGLEWESKDVTKYHETEVGYMHR